jgi:predicted kinase
MDKILYIIRGIPNSGKSTLGRYLATDQYCFAADDYFEGPDGYKFDPSKLGEAHKMCMTNVEQALRDGQPIVAVANTFSRRWEYESYQVLANNYGYIVAMITMPATRRGDNGHNVPPEAVARMLDRWEW